MLAWITGWLAQLGTAATALTGGITAGVALLTAAGQLVSGPAEERRARAIAAAALLGLLAAGLLLIALFSRPAARRSSADEKGAPCSDS